MVVSAVGLFVAFRCSPLMAWLTHFGRVVFVTCCALVVCFACPVSCSVSKSTGRLLVFSNPRRRLSLSLSSRTSGTAIYTSCPCPAKKKQKQQGQRKKKTRVPPRFPTLCPRRRATSLIKPYICARKPKCIYERKRPGEEGERPRTNSNPWSSPLPSLSPVSRSPTHDVGKA